MDNYKILFYEKADGKQPAREFIVSLDIKMRAKIMKLSGRNITDRIISIEMEERDE